MTTQDIINRVRKPILITWGYIAADSGAESNEEAMELCIDSGRIVMEAKDQEADDLIKQLCNELGYSITLKLLSSNIRLV